MGHILRSSQVKLEGRRDVGKILSGADGVQGQPGSRTEPVRIVERHDDCTVLEVTCSCGNTLYVRCEHG